MVPVLNQTTLVLIAQYDPGAILSAFETHGVTIFAGGPSPIYHGLMGHPNFKTTDYSSLRICSGGGSPFAVETVKAWQAVTGNSICEGYGMSEGAPISLNPDGERNKVGTCGPPSPDTEIGIVDVESGNTVLPTGENGEIRVRGPQMMAAYWQRPEETADTVRDDWIYTGDIGHLDEDGYVVIVDRKKDMAIVNGFNVFPREIDEVLFGHPDILEAATLGVPDPMMGEVIHAYVVAQSGSALDEAAVLEFCEGALIRYKVPGKVFVVAALPKTPAAKVDKRALRKQSIKTG
jgi:long-chain acyl-CoA synthetase